MTVQESTERPPAPGNVCALVVGIETNEFTRGRELRGAAARAARFARWLLKNGVCRPERLTLMTNHNEVSYIDNSDNASPAAELVEIEKISKGIGAGHGVNFVPQGNTQQDFKSWMTGGYGPKTTDLLFILFWEGHGLTYPHRPFDPSLCLLGADAGSYQLSHVELNNLLDAVGKTAPDAHLVALVDACRNAVPPPDESRLREGKRPVSPGPRPAGRSRVSLKRSIGFAAAPGRTTRESGWQDKTFAQVVLELVGPLPYGQGPEVLFDSGPGHSIGGKLRMDPAVRKTQTTFRYLNSAGGSGDDWLDPPPESEFDVPHPQWTKLLRMARRIDRTWPGTSAPVLFGALCHAIGLENVIETANGVKNVLPHGNLQQLFTTLHGRTRVDPRYPPPLVVACYFVANMPTRGRVPGLNDWCDRWARSADDKQRLANAKVKLPVVSPDRDFLGVLVDNVNDPDVNADDEERYLIKAFAWALGDIVRLGESEPVSGSEIAGQVAHMMGVAERRGLFSGFAQTIVDLALPRDLIGRRVEYDTYNGSQDLGTLYAVSIRDLDRLRGPHPHGRQAEVTLKTWGLIEAFDRSSARNSEWSEKIQWVRCDQPDQSKSDTIDQAVSSVDNGAEDPMFALALEFGNGTATYANGIGRVDAPAELTRSLDKGAAIVISLHHEGGCERCPYRQASDEREGGQCAIPRVGKRLIEDKVNTRGRQGLIELPMMIREIRPALTARRLKVGVLIDDQSRLWSDFVTIESGAG